MSEFQERPSVDEFVEGLTNLMAKNLRAESISFRKGVADRVCLAIQSDLDDEDTAPLFVSTGPQGIDLTVTITPFEEDDDLGSFEASAKFNLADLIVTMIEDGVDRPYVAENLAPYVEALKASAARIQQKIDSLTAGG